MGACASNFRLAPKSAADAAALDDVTSRDLNLAEAEMVKKNIKTPAPGDVEPKRQMLGHLFKENDAGTIGNIGKETGEVKQEDKPKGNSQDIENMTSAKSGTDAPAKDAASGVENKGSEPEKEDVEPIVQNVETEASIQKATEEKPAETAKFETSEKVENQGTEKPDELNKPVEESGPNKEPGTPFLEKAVGEKTAASEETHEAETTNEVEALESKKIGEEQKPASMQKEGTEVVIPEAEKSEWQKAGSEEGAGAEDEPAETTTKQQLLQAPEGDKAEDEQKPDSKGEEKKTGEISGEAEEVDIAADEKAAEREETEEVEKAAEDVAEKKTEVVVEEQDQPGNGSSRKTETLLLLDKQAVEAPKPEQSGGQV